MIHKGIKCAKEILNGDLYVAHKGGRSLFLPGDIIDDMRFVDTRPSKHVNGLFVSRFIK